MKKNAKGFTLIELLAVITIMGILMIVAIPAVTRTIENSRKDTFVNTVQNYVGGAKTMWASDNLSCTDNTSGTDFVSSAVSAGFYYIEVNSASTSVPQLLESGGKSSWGSRDIKGYILVHVYDVTGPGKDGKVNGALACGTTGDPSTSGSNACVSDDDVATRKIDYYPVMSDGIHGINTTSAGALVHPGKNLKKSENLKRGNLQMTSITYEKAGWVGTATAATAPKGWVSCTSGTDCVGGFKEGTNANLCVEV